MESFLLRITLCVCHYLLHSLYAIIYQPERNYVRARFPSASLSPSKRYKHG